MFNNLCAAVETVVVAVESDGQVIDTTKRIQQLLEELHRDLSFIVNNLYEVEISIHEN